MRTWIVHYLTKTEMIGEYNEIKYVDDRKPDFGTGSGDSYY